MRYLLIICSLLFLLPACKSTPSRQVTPAFYFWKQSWTGNATELEYLRQLPAGKLYVKMFDVAPGDKPGEAVPVAIFQQQQPLPADQEIVPVIFLMNEIWNNPPDTNMAVQLAQRTEKLLGSLCSSLPDKQPIKEIQIDCDWTKTTKDTYFRYLKALQHLPFFKGKDISATIRMHQIKFRNSSGIPPVNKGLLMCYNMGDLRKPGDHNSILDISTMESYIGNDRISNYPLPLDIALPLFQWTVLFENNQYKGILRNVGTRELENKNLFIPHGRQLFVVQKDTLINGYMLKKGSELRREITNVQLLEDAAQLISAQRQSYNPTVIFYHLDAATLDNYPLHELQKVYRLFN